MNYAEHQVRALILPKKERCIDGIWTHRSPIISKPTATTPSGALRMSKSLAYDCFLAAATVIPAVIVLIATEHMLIGLGLGAAIFLSIEYGIPAYRAGKFDSMIAATSRHNRTVAKFARTQLAQLTRQTAQKRARA